jgi:hypothetical protein
MAKKVLPVYFEDNWRERIRKVSERDDISMGELVRRAVKIYVGDAENKARPREEINREHVTGELIADGAH